jgi:hypothetical protein
MRYIKHIISAAVIGLGLVSCTGKFEQINTNPNKNTVGSVQAYNLFEPIFYATGKWNVNSTYVYAGPISGQFANTKNNTATADIHRWNLSASHMQGFWDDSARYGYDCHHMIATAQKHEDPYYEALGYIFKVYHLSNLVTLFGDIPYTEAYRGPSEGLKTPAFDSQQDVFGFLCNDLEYAVSILKEDPKPSYGKLDTMYGDDCQKWIKFANSLKIRLLHRIANADQTAWNKIQEMVNNPAEYPVFESIEEQAVIPFSGVDPYQSYFSTGNVTAENFKNYKLSREVVGMLYDSQTKYEDPRLSVFGLKNGNADWKGTIPGSTDPERSAADNDATHLNTHTLNRNNAPSRIMEYSELLFIYAEGVLKGKLTMPQSAKYYYEEAVKASVKTWSAWAEYNEVPKDGQPVSFNDDAIATLLKSTLASYDAVAAGTSPYQSVEELVLSQKWLSLFWNGFEAYNEWRRNEYPIITIASGTLPNDYEMPTRFEYPMTVRASNSANMNIALDRMAGPNDMHTPLWWSYKALNNGSRPEHVYEKPAESPEVQPES